MFSLSLPSLLLGTKAVGEFTILLMVNHVSLLYSNLLLLGMSFLLTLSLDRLPHHSTPPLTPDPLGPFRRPLSWI